MGFSWREAAAIGVLMNTRGLMEMVVLNIGLEIGVISRGLFTMIQQRGGHGRGDEGHDHGHRRGRVERPPPFYPSSG